MAGVEAGAKLRRADTQEKNVLPSADGKIHIHVCPSVSACWIIITSQLADVKQEKDRKSLLSEVEQGHNLQHVETVERNVIPDSDGQYLSVLVFQQSPSYFMPLTDLKGDRSCCWWPFVPFVYHILLSYDTRNVSWAFAAFVHLARYI